MFPPVPPRQEPPARQEAYTPPEPEAAEYLPISRPGPSARWRVVRFALLGGSLTAILGGIVVGWLNWVLTRSDPGAGFGFPGRVFYERPLLGAHILAAIVALAPLLFVVFALAGAAQVIAESMGRASGRAARLLGEALSEFAPHRPPRPAAERGAPPPGTAADIVRPLAHDLNLEIDPERPARD
jgi:hypothetical protein